MSRKKLAWANKEVEAFVCILAEEDVVYDVYVAAAVIDIRPATKGTVGSGNATSERSWAIPPPPYRTFAIRSVPHQWNGWKRGIISDSYSDTTEELLVNRLGDTVLINHSVN